MRKVIDSNMMQSPRLDEYLARSRDNYAVVTDYAAMEAYKGEGASMIHQTMEILGCYPSQVLILKDTQTVCGLKARGNGLQRRMIDWEQTAYFPTFCRALKQGQAKDKLVQQQIENFNKAANAHMERMLKDGEAFPDAFADLARMFTADELRRIRTRAPYKPATVDKIMQAVLSLAAIFFRDHPRVQKWPSADQLRHTYIFRFALCSFVLVLMWIEAGAPKQLKPERIRNDTVDITFATYGTFFDGLLTGDKKAGHIHLQARVMLNLIFGLNLHV